MSSTTSDNPLGALLSEHSIGRFGAALPVLGVALLVGAAGLAGSAIAMGGASEASVVWFGSGVAGVLGLVLLLRWLLLRGSLVRVHERGLVHRRGSKEWTLAWPEVDHVILGVSKVRGPFPVHFDIRLRSKSGKRFKFCNYTRAGELSHNIGEQLARCRAPSALAQLRAGVTLDFGVLKLSRHGVARRLRRTLPWKELGSVEFANGRMAIRTTAGRVWSRPYVLQVRNVYLVHSLMQRVGRNMRPADAERGTDLMGAPVMRAVKPRPGSCHSAPSASIA